MLKKTTVQIPLFATQDKSVDPKVMSIDRLEVAENVKVTQAGRVSPRDGWIPSNNLTTFRHAVPAGDRVLLQLADGSVESYVGTANNTVLDGPYLPFSLTGKQMVAACIESKHQAEVCWHPTDGSYLVAWLYNDIGTANLGVIDCVLYDSLGNVKQSFKRVTEYASIDGTVGPSRFGLCYNPIAGLYFLFYRHTGDKGLHLITMNPSTGAFAETTLLASSTSYSGIVRAFYYSNAASGYKTYICYDTDSTKWRVARISDAGAISESLEITTSRLIDCAMSQSSVSTSYLGLLVALNDTGTGTNRVDITALPLNCSSITSTTIVSAAGSSINTPYFDLALSSSGARAYWSYSAGGVDYLSTTANWGLVDISRADISSGLVATLTTPYIRGATVACYPFTDSVSGLEILPIVLHPQDASSAGCFCLAAIPVSTTAAVTPQAIFGHGFTLPFYHLASRSMSRPDTVGSRLAFLTIEGQGYFDSSPVAPYGSVPQPIFTSSVSIYTFNYSRCPSEVNIGDNTFLPGALPRISYGGDLWHLSLFPGNKGWNQNWPADTGTTYSYSYSYLVERTDPYGHRIRSAPAPLKQFRSVNPISISDAVTIPIPCINLASQVGTNFKDARLLLYRTVNNGSIPYLVTAVQNSSWSLYVNVTDTMTDATLLSSVSASQGHPALIDTSEITAGPCPPCSVAAAFQKRLFVVSDENPRQLWFTRELDEEASSFAPRFSEELVVLCPETITSLQVLDDKLVCFSRDRVFVLTGEGPGGDGTGGTYQVSQLQAETGALAHESTLAGENEILFMSPAGMKLLDRGLNISFVPEWETLPAGTTVVNSVCIPEQRLDLFLLSDGSIRVRDQRWGGWGTWLALNNPQRIFAFNGKMHFRDLYTGTLMVATPGQFLDNNGSGNQIILTKVKTPQIKLSDVAQGVQRIWHIGIQSVEDATATGRVMQIKLYPDNASVASTTYNLALPGPYVRIGSNPQRCSSMAIEISNAGSATTAHPFELLGLTLECGVNRAIVAKTTQNG